MKLLPVVVLAGASAWALGAQAGTPEKWAVSAEGGYQMLNNATDSAKAVFDGSTGGGAFGGSLRLSLTRSFFAGAGLHVFNKSGGQRVFVDGPGGTVFPLGHPLEIRVRPIYGFVGYRLRPGSLLSPYLAVGAGSASYRETSTVAGVTTTDTASKFTWHGAAGLEYAAGRFGLGAEVRYTGLPDVVGLGGVSRIYNENDLGGISMIGRLSFRR
jgi:hypothetical protein